MFAQKTNLKYLKYSEQIDAKWSEKNNHPSFIHLDDPQILEKKTKTISLFDVKTKMSVEDIYN